MRRVVRYVVVVAGVATMVTGGSSAVSSAAVIPAVPSVAAVQPSAGDVVGVGHPLTVRFTETVADRDAAESTIVVTSPPGMTGRFTWLNNAVVQWIPDQFWPAHSTVTALVGGMPTSFETGAAVVGVANISAYTFTVSVDDQVLRQMPASMGKAGFATPVGSFSAIEKQRSVMFDSRTLGIPLDDEEGYLIRGEYAVRVTWGGVYVHSAPWSVGSQGYANVSHGCINLGPENAAWYFDMVSPGDPIIVQA